MENQELAHSAPVNSGSTPAAETPVQISNGNGEAAKPEAAAKPAKVKKVVRMPPVKAAPSPNGGNGGGRAPAMPHLCSMATVVRKKPTKHETRTTKMARNISESLPLKSKVEFLYPGVFVAQRTKVVCTLGPSIEKEETLMKLIRSGVSGFRLNAAHFPISEFASRINFIRATSEKVGVPVAIMIEFRGPDIRTGPFPKGSANLQAGDKYTFYRHYVDGNEKQCSINYWNLPGIVKTGDRIFVDYNAIEFSVDAVTDNSIETTCLNAGLIGDHKKIYIPDRELELSFLSYEDTEIIYHSCVHGADFLIIPGVRTVEDVLAVKELSGVQESGIGLLLKVETSEIVERFPEVLVECDGAVICRSGISCKLSYEQVPLIQNNIIELCNSSGKPVLIIDQVVQSMHANPRPTRAEVTDVANAIQAGCDGVIITRPTATGDFPMEAAATVTNISKETEALMDWRTRYEQARVDDHVRGSVSITETICSSAVKTAWDVGARLMVVFTGGGVAAHCTVRYSPHVLCLCITSDVLLGRQLCISRGVVPILVKNMRITEAVIDDTVQLAKMHGYLQSEDIVVVMSGKQEGVSGSTNQFRVITA